MRILPHILIVGAGPSGTAAAISARRHGMAVTLLEAEGQPTRRPGETLHPGTLRLLEELGLGERLGRLEVPRHEGLDVAWGESRRRDRFGCDERGPWKGASIPREVLDRMLRERAMEVGCDLRSRVRARGPLLREGKVVGVRTDDESIHADFVFDATGARQWLARHLHLPARRESQRLMAVFGWVRGDDRSIDEPVLRTLEDGWEWIAPIGGNQLAWVRLKCAEVASGPPEELAHLAPLSAPRTRDVTWRLVESCSGPGYFLLGDAAFVVDPLAGHGVLRAVMSGMMAVHVIARDHASRGLRTPHFLHQFRKWNTEWFARDVDELRRHYFSLGLVISPDREALLAGQRGDEM